MTDFMALRAARQTADASVAQALYHVNLASTPAALAALAKARTDARESRDAVNAAIAAVATPRTDVASTLRGDLPVVLFPVRLETRFVSNPRNVRAGSGGIAAARLAPSRGTAGLVGTTGAGASAVPSVGTLQIRIYPDEILSNTHEAELTDEEWQAGRSYWTAGDTLSSWAALIARFPAPRAAWIVSQTKTEQRPPARAASWTRPATAVLPDKFIAFAYRGGVLVASGEGSAVVEPLVLTISPAIDESQLQTIPGTTLQIDSDLLWTLQFPKAKAAGMGIELPVSADDWAQGYDLLTVVGVKGTFSPVEAGQHIQSVLDGHHYTRGLALVPQGTPTSNLPGQPSGFPRSDPGGAVSFAIERQTPPTGDGLLFASALGVNAGVVAHLDGTGLQEDAAAKAMLTALWPATLGYHLEQMMAPADPSLPPPFDATAVANAYTHTRVNVRPGGPYPAFRIGSVPYGLLPVTSLARLAAVQRGPLPTALNALRERLLSWSAQAPRVRPGSPDPDGDLVNVLRLDASSLSFLVQVLVGGEVQKQLGQLPGLNGAAVASTQSLQAGIATATLQSAGLPTANPPRVSLASFGVSEPYGGVLVSSLTARDKPLPDAANYITWILGELRSGGAALATDAIPATYERTFLYQLLRHAVLVEKQRTATPGLREPEVIGLAGRIAATAAARVVPPGGVVSGPPPVAAPPTVSEPPPVSHMADLNAALAVLAGLSIASLERMLSETLDLCSHRFDAWITSLATARLAALRGTAAATTPAAAGSHFGAYGWVQDLKPTASPFFPGEGGFIHAPSPNHAQTAAILRNGYLTRGTAGASPYALDLSSARVRAGLTLLARIRDGEALSEILGTELETRLRANPALATTYLEPLRAAFPSPSSVVVDGLQALLSWRANPASPHYPSAIMSELSQLVDAAADLLTAESVYQMVRGNPVGAAAGLDALGQGARPPDPQVVHAPVAGTTLTHRVGVVLDDTAPPGWASEATPRAVCCRYVDGWLGQVLPAPDRVKCRVRSATGTQVVSLAQLAIRPLDLVALAGTPLDSDSEIDRRIRVASGQPAATINYAADAALGPDAVTFPAVMELSRAIDRLISGARPLVASDLATASDSVTDVVDPDVAARAQAALAALIALDLSTPATQRQQLRAAAAFGFAGAYVTDDASVSDVATTAQRVDAERQVRIRQAGATSDPADIVRAVFGRRLPMVGQFTFPNTIPAALAGPQGLTQNDVRRWLQKAARVRPGLDRWRRVRLIAEALNAPPVKWEVAQLPYASSASWAAIPFNAGAAPASGTASIVLHRPGQTAPSPTWAGLLIEEWSELIPAAVQQTGIAFNYSSPRAEAPQAVLLAVPPVDSATWSTEVVADIVRETFELAQIRLLTPDLLKAFSLLLPATCLSVNTGGDALSTNLWTAVVSPIQVVAQGS